MTDYIVAFIYDMDCNNDLYKDLQNGTIPVPVFREIKHFLVNGKQVVRVAYDSQNKGDLAWLGSISTPAYEINTVYSKEHTTGFDDHYICVMSNGYKTVDRGEKDKYSNVNYPPTETAFDEFLNIIRL